MLLLLFQCSLKANYMCYLCKPTTFELVGKLEGVGSGVISDGIYIKIIFTWFKKKEDKLNTYFW